MTYATLFSVYHIVIMAYVAALFFKAFGAAPWDDVERGFFDWRNDLFAGHKLN
jgi:hypothetical protein